MTLPPSSTSFLVLSPTSVIERERERERGGISTLATSRESRCSPLVFYCYAPAKQHQNNKGGEGGTAATETVTDLPPPLPPPPPPPPLPPLRSNLKKAARDGEQLQQQQQLKEVTMEDRRRKVSWPDAHGRDLAHVQMFDSSSVIDEGKLKGVIGTSCICSIQ